MRAKYLRFVFTSSILLATTSFTQNTPSVPKQWTALRFFDRNGAIVPKGKVCTYRSGTMVPLSTYRDPMLTLTNPNPLLLSDDGQPTENGIYFSDSKYRFVLRTGGADETCSTGAVAWTIDDVNDIAQLLASGLVRQAFDGVQPCSLSPGIDAGVKIAACINALPPTGGIADARGFVGEQIISVNMFEGVRKPFTLLLAAARFDVSVTQTLSAANQIRIIGIGGGGETNQTVFRWQGPDGGTVLLLDRVRDSSFENFTILPNKSVGIGIRIDHLTEPTDGILSENDTFRNIAVGASLTGVQIGNRSVGNNAEHVFENLWVTGAGTYGVFINNSQSKNIKFYSGGITSRKYGIYQNNGSFKSFGTVFANNTVSDYQLSNPNDPIVIEANYTEGSAKFLDTGGPSGNSYSVNLIGNQIQCNAIGGDKIIIRYRFTGAFNLIGNNFCGGVNISDLRVDVGSSRSTAFNSIGNTYPNSAPFSSSGGSVVMVSLNDLYTETSGQSGSLPNQVSGTFKIRGTASLDDVNIEGNLGVSGPIRLLGTINGQSFNSPSTDQSDKLDLKSDIPSEDVMTAYLNTVDGKHGYVGIDGKNGHIRLVPTAPTNYVQIEGSAKFTSWTFAKLPSMPFNADGIMVYCSDCTMTNPCRSGGTGAFAKRINNAWVCN